MVEHSNSWLLRNGCCCKRNDTEIVLFACSMAETKIPHLNNQNRTNSIDIISKKQGWSLHLTQCRFCTEKREKINDSLHQFHNSKKGKDHFICFIIISRNNVQSKIDKFIKTKQRNNIPGCITLGIERTPDALIRRFNEPYLSLIDLAESWELALLWNTRKYMNKQDWQESKKYSNDSFGKWS